MSAKRDADPDISNESKKVKVDAVPEKTETAPVVDKSLHGIAILKPEYIISNENEDIIDDDLAESAPVIETEKENEQKNKKGKKRGQNKARNLVQTKEEMKVCVSIIDPEAKKPCVKGEECSWVHDPQIYLDQKEEDIDADCPVWNELGYCPMGIRCRFLKSHFDPESKSLKYRENYNREDNKDEVNLLDSDTRIALYRKKMDFPKSEVSIKLNDENGLRNMSVEKRQALENEFKDFKIKTSEKKRLDYAGKKVLSPLTTVGNLPYRRLMKTLGADVTFSEMAFSTSLISGQNSEWALLKAHKSEMPNFGAQISASKTWQASKAAELISRFGSNNISEINLNCGCPIDLLYKKGECSALMNSPNRMRLLLKTMNDCSGDIPITVKMRMGVQDQKPVAIDIAKRLLEAGDIGAITIHGRSRQQRYTKEANWDYINEVGKVVKEFNEQYEENKDVSDRANPVYLIGNGDIYNYEDWNENISKEGIDSIMVARGALIKPWIFEEIEAQQYLDKSATERLEYLRQYSNFALQHWGTDDFGINTSRRFLCEFLSFTYRYIPVGILDKLPPKLNQRPPKWRGRNEMETLLGSNDYKDWIKITEMFLGKANENFNFVPKHKSNAY